VVDEVGGIDRLIIQQPVAAGFDDALIQLIIEFFEDIFDIADDERGHGRLVFLVENFVSASDQDPHDVLLLKLIAGRGGGSCFLRLFGPGSHSFYHQSGIRFSG
jgi:hypothetical protein